MTANKENEWKLISSALKEGDTDRLRMMLRGNDINAPQFGEAQDKPLLHAILYSLVSWEVSLDDSEKILRVLDECGADANLSDDKENTPLSIAIFGGFEMEHIVDQLVECLGADASKEQESFDVAVDELDDNGVCELLIQHGLKPEAHGQYTRLLFRGRKENGRADGYEYMLDMLLTMNLILPDERDARQNTPLHYVVRVLDCNRDYLFNFRSTSYENDRERLTTTLCTMLLDHGANPLATNANGRTALDVWLKHREISAGDTDDVEELLLNSMADARECLHFDTMDYFAQTNMGKLLHAELIRIIKKMTSPEQKRGKRFTRQQAIDAMLAAEGIAPDGYYYRDCIKGEVEIDITEFRFRHYIATTGAHEYEDIVEELRDEHGRFYSGIHADAREIIDGRLTQRGIYFK